MSYADYLLLEGSSPERHEFLRGAVYAMAGGTPEHGALAAAWIRELGMALRGRPCRVFTSDVRVRIRETGLTTYPDVSVVCGRLETRPEDVLASQSEPSVEVYRRNAEGRFELYEFRAGDAVERACVGVSVAVDAIYANPLAG